MMGVPLTILLLIFVLPAGCTVFNTVVLATLTYDDGATADWGVDALTAVQIAVAAVNDPTSGVLGRVGHTLNVSAVIDTRCDGNVAASEVSQLLKSDAAMAGVVAFLGPGCGEAAVSAASAAAADGRGITVISGSATASSLGDSKDFPNFVRVVPSADIFDTSVLYAAARYDFMVAPGNRAGIVFTEPDVMGTEAAAAMNTTAAVLGINVVAGASFPRDSSEEVVIAAVARLQTAGVSTVLVAAPVPETRSIFAALSALSMSPRAVLANEAIGEESQSDEAALEAAQGYLTVLPGPYPLCATSVEFASAFSAAVGPGRSDPANRWATFSYDSVLLLAAAIVEAAAETAATAITTPAAVGAALRTVSIAGGVTGEVFVAKGSNNRGSACRLEVLNLQGFNVTAQRDFAVVGECLCDPTADPPVVAHTYHGEIVWSAEAL